MLVSTTFHHYNKVEEAPDLLGKSGRARTHLRVGTYILGHLRIPPKLDSGKPMQAKLLKSARRDRELVVINGKEFWLWRLPGAWKISRILDLLCRRSNGWGVLQRLFKACWKILSYKVKCIYWHLALTKWHNSIATVEGNQLCLLKWWRYHVAPFQEAFMEICRLGNMKMTKVATMECRGPRFWHWRLEQIR